MKDRHDTPHSAATEGAAFVKQTPCYCIRLRRAAGAVTEFYDRLFSPFGVSVNQFSLLIAMMEREGSGTGELARYLGLEKSTLVRSLQPLIKMGLAEDTAPAGNRAHQWRASEAGKALVEAAMPVWKKAQADVRSALDGKHRLLMELLEDLDGLAVLGEGSGTHNPA